MGWLKGLVFLLVTGGLAAGLFAVYQENQAIVLSLQSLHAKVSNLQTQLGQVRKDLNEMRMQENGS